LKHFIAAAALAAALPGAASALSFSGTYGVSGSAFSDPGLVIQTAPSNGSYAFNLDVGQSTTVKLFDIWTNENSVGSDDTVPQSINVGFDMTDPVSTGNVSGSTVGNSLLFGLFQSGSVSWDGPLQLAFGKGGILSVMLNNATFNDGVFGLDEGQRHGAGIKATFTYEQSPSAVPLPAGLGLMAAGVGALGAAARRRKAAA